MHLPLYNTITIKTFININIMGLNIGGSYAFAALQYNNYKNIY